jgi:hypothetical protein
MVGVGLRTGTSKRNANNVSLPDFAKYIPLRLNATEVRRGNASFFKPNGTTFLLRNSTRTHVGASSFHWFLFFFCSRLQRALLTVLEQTLHVSEYTDNVDVTSARRGIKTRRILDGILEACHIGTGLMACSGKERSLLQASTDNLASGGSKLPISFRLKSKKSKKKKKKKKRVEDAVEEEKEEDEGAGSSSWASREPRDNAVLFQTMFEISRRNKVLNPSSMRTTYGKLMYLLQDAQNPTVAKSLGFSLHKDLVLVAPYLEERGCSELLRDERLEGATQFISDRNPATGRRLERDQVQALVEEKRRLSEELVEAYTSDKISADDVKRCIDSIADAISYVESNVAPVQTMLKYLEDNFDPEEIERGFSLELSGRRSNYSSYSSYSRYGFSAYSSSQSEGPKLSHSHPTQYTFVWQSLQLWCKVMRNMHRLWVCADDDLLSTSNSYHLHNTGQGLNRVQTCPRVRKVMQNLLHQTQQEAGQPWVGLSVIHLGDRDVPNALIFIDKYTQIPRFLNPLVAFLQGLPELCQDERIDSYIREQFGSQHKLKMTVLCDYFKHGFDGSGDDGGSCIDGRLTSSWNWTSRVAKKS